MGIRRGLMIIFFVPRLSRHRNLSGTKCTPLDRELTNNQLRGDMWPMSASLIGRLGSSVFRLFTTTVSMSLTGSCFSSESAPGPFHHGIRERGGTIYWAALPSDERQVQRTLRTHLIHRPARDIMPPRGGTRVSPIRFDYVQLSRCNSVLAPAELGAINPDAVHDDGQATRQRDDCLFHAPAPGDLHRPGLEPGPFG